MKKLSILMTVAAAAGLASCSMQGPQAKLKTDVDSLSYSIGMVQTQGLQNYLVGRLGVDTAYIADFIKGVNDGTRKDQQA